MMASGNKHFCAEFMDMIQYLLFTQFGGFLESVYVIPKQCGIHSHGTGKLRNVYLLVG